MKQISKAELEKKYRSMKGKDLAKELGVTFPTLLAYLEEAGIKLKGKGNRVARKIKIVE